MDKKNKFLNSNQPSSNKEEDRKPMNTSAFAKGTETSKFSSSSEQALFAFPEAPQSRLARCNNDKHWKLFKVPRDSKQAKPSGEEAISIDS